MLFFLYFYVFCMCLHDHHKTNLMKLNYVPVGLGQGKFSEGWIKDNTGENISSKNKNSKASLKEIKNKKTGWWQK